MRFLDFAKSILGVFGIIVSEYKSREWRFGNFRANFFAGVSLIAFWSIRFAAYHINRFMPFMNSVSGVSRGYKCTYASSNRTSIISTISLRKFLYFP